MRLKVISKIILIIRFIALINGKIIPDKEIGLQTCYKNIIQSYMGNNTNVVAITDGTLNFDYSVSNPHVVLNIINTIGFDITIRGFKYYIIKTKGFYDLEIVVEKLLMFDIYIDRNYGTKQYVIFMNKTDKLMEAFRILFNNYFYNVIIVVASHNNFNIYTSYPYAKQAMCGRNVIINSLGNCHNITAHTHPRYPPYLKDCDLAFYFVNKSTTKTTMAYENSKVVGLLAKPLNILTDSYDLNISYIIMPEEYSSHLFTTNANNTSKISNFCQPCAENKMTIWNSFFSKESTCEIAKPLFTENTCWILAKPKKISNLKVIVSIFDYQVWSFILIIYILFTILSRLLSQFYVKRDFKKETIFLESFKMTIGMAANGIPKSSLLRIFTILYIIYSVQIVCHFLASYSSLLTAPAYEEKVNTIEKLAYSSKIPLTKSQYAMELFKNEESHSSMKIYNKVQIFPTQEHDELNFILVNDKYALFRYCWRIKTTPEAVKAHLDSFENNLTVTNSWSYMFSKDSLIIYTMDHVIDVIKENGLMEKWKNDIKEDCAFKIQTQDFENLKLEHIVIAFVVLGIGHTVALLIFILEICKI